MSSAADRCCCDPGEAMWPPFFHCFASLMALQLFSFCPGGEPLWLTPATPEVAAPEPEAKPPIELQQDPLPTKRKRAKKSDGTFMADDPATPDVDEAWVESREN